MAARDVLVEEQASLETLLSSVYPRRGKLVLEDDFVRIDQP